MADYINTAALPQVKVAQPGYNRIQPASMKGIKPGQWLLIDNGAGNPAQQGPNPEAVAVVWSDPTTFLAEFSYPHNPGFTIEASSFAGLQIQLSYPLATIQAVPNATTLWVDQTTGGPPLSGTTYTILTAYIQPDPYCWRVKFGVDPTQGIPLDCENNTYEDILIGDPQLTNSANPAVIVPTPFLGGGGVAQWMTYPLIFSEYYLNLIIVKTWPKLIQDSDRSPNFLDSEMFIAGAKADSLRTNLISRPGEKDPFFNPQLAQTYEALFEKYLSEAEERDESLSHHRLQSYARTVAGAFSAVYWQSHPGWPTDFGSWSQ